MRVRACIIWKESNVTLSRVDDCGFIFLIENIYMYYVNKKKNKTPLSRMSLR